MSYLLPCPCGKVPTKLNIQDGNTYRWRIISGDCCGEWAIESSRIEINSTPEQIEKQCATDWNNSSRGNDTRLREQLAIAVGALAHSRACLELANTEGLIFDTIWAGDAETLFDYMDSALAQIRERSDV